MDYYYETLNDQRFQKLCQTLILVQFPNAQIFPIGQPDGGRDAISFHPESDRDEFIVFQVKFSRNPDSKTKRDVIESLIKSEQSKVAKLVQHGATHYILATNVGGTAHFDAGSIDKTNTAMKLLADKFGISTQVWWRDDLDRRLEIDSDIKWSYPEILKLTDVLPLLIQKPGETEDFKAARALQNYMATQYETDRDVKFKQVELQRKLTDLFVDLPLNYKGPRTERNIQQHLPINHSFDINAYISQLDYYEDDEDGLEDLFNHSGLAGAFLLQMPLIKGVSRFVIEGAPGQGKSTVTQFLCQVNRLRLLNKGFELSMVDDIHKNTMVRAPFRVDLRDYAVWISDRASLTSTTHSSLSPMRDRSLESFLAMQVAEQSGGLSITVDELSQFFSRSHSVIVLDGFDEVADTTTRKRIVEEICHAATRLDIHMDTHAKSMQIIVTSRPAAFVDSPGFPEDDWIHLELKDLRSDNIEKYKDKWIEAQGLSEDEGNQVSSTLNDKLEQQHISDLAHNPMQLAILLHLIHIQGAALPEKRTTLYDEYIKLFFNREAEKSTVVRDHRELLLSIHGMLAWVLHIQAEDGSGSGSISKSALHNEVKSYLETKEHNPQLAEVLLTGSVERVGALVSRVEGMFEFEVQPLREYFAARHLYKTAPYSPAGQARKGTRPERFQAISRSLYWTNVTRFFCGFYDAGELASLVEGIIDLSEQNGYRLINQPRRLAMMLLSDRVFSQEPRTRRRLLEFINDEPGFQRLTSSTTIRFRFDMGLPFMEGGNNMFEACLNKLEQEENPCRRRLLRVVMAQNADRETMKSIWTSRFENDLMKCGPLREATDFGVLNSFTPQEIAGLAKDDMDFHLRWLMQSNNYEAIVDDMDLHMAAKKSFFENEIEFPYRWHSTTDSIIALEALTEILRPQALSELFFITDSSVAANVILSRGYVPKARDLLERVRRQYENGEVTPLESFTLFIVDLMSKKVDGWQQSLTPWATLVERGLDEAPGCYTMVRTAMIATASRANATEGRWDENGFTAKKGLVNRLFYARHKHNDADWWRERLTEITTETAKHCLTILVSWGAPEVIAALKTDIDTVIEGLSRHDWDKLWSMSRLISQISLKHGAAIPESWFQTMEYLSPRMALMLLVRVENKVVARRLSRHYFNKYIGDDTQVLWFATHIELMEATDKSIDWDHVQHLSIRAQEKGIQLYIPDSRSLNSRVPIAVAKTVLSDSDNYSEHLVAVCEQAYATNVAQAVSKVSHIAMTDDWFTAQN